MVKGKRGQFYLISAIILSSVIIGISVLPNYLKKTQNLDFQDFVDEVSIESKKTIDFGTNNSYSQTQMNSLMQNFTKEYVNKRLNKMSLYFIFGKSNNITISGFQENNKSVFISSGNSILVTQNSGNFSGSIDPLTQEANLTIGTNSFYFEISNGENFYYVISQSLNDEEYFSKG